MEGKKNYWWYESIHKSQGLGWMYHLNKWFTILYVGLFLLHLLIGWWRAVIPLLLVATCVLCILDVTLWLPVFFTRGNEKLSKRQQADYIGSISILGFAFPMLICIALVLFFLKMQK